jgi:hypothetical protein
LSRSRAIELIAPCVHETRSFALVSCGMLAAEIPRMEMQSRWAWALFVLVGCSAPPSGGGGGDAGAQNDAGAAQDVYVPFVPGDGGDAGACNPPDMLVVLDRSDSMSKPPDGDAGASKWSLAVSALDDITAAPTDGTLRFGLELLPDQPGGKNDAGACTTGLLEIDTGLGNGAAIASTLASTQLMKSTPIGGALGVAQATLAKGHVDGRGQNVLLVTDGNETCDANPALPIVQALAASGVHTYVVGFGGAVDAGLLDDLACAGLTAKDFSNSCTQTQAGYVSNVPPTTHVFFDASSGGDLENALATITTGTCCGCQVN